MLIGAQVAVCMVLLISAGLLMRGLYAAQTVDPGFEYRNVAVVSFDLRGPGYDARKTLAFQSQLMDRIGSFPGIDAVAQVGRTPLSPGRTTTMVHLAGQAEWHEIDMNMVSPGYFSLIAIPIVRGRTFMAGELSDASRAVIVTEATARRYWPGQDPIGQTLAMGMGRGQEMPLQVVGVAKDAQVSQVAQTESSYMYLPAAPIPPGKTQSDRSRSRRSLARWRRPFAPPPGSSIRAWWFASTGWRKISISGARCRV